MRQLLWTVALVSAFACQAAAQPVEGNTDRPGGDFKGIYVSDSSECQSQCRADGRCQSWTFVKKDRHCMLKNTIPQARSDACCASGVQRSASIKNAPKPNPPRKRTSVPIDHPEEGRDAQ
jgi:hypothetical protein